MNMQQCPNKHYYDADKYSVCPHCSTESAASIPTKGPEAIDLTMPGIDIPNMDTLPGNDRKTPSDMKNLVDNNSENSSLDIPINPQNPQEGTDMIETKTVAKIWSAVKEDPVTGWLVCVEGKDNFGKSFKLGTGGNFVGRGANMDVKILGDDSISRNKHCIILYEPKNNMFIIEPGESRQLTYLNDKVVLSPVELKSNDIIQLGETKLMFIPCCTDKFKWEDVAPKEDKE